MAEKEARLELNQQSGTFLAAVADAARRLRDRAVEEARARDNSIPADLTRLSVEDARSMLHDLQVHRIELELQNEELRASQEQLELARARYFDLYDLAPVGYVTISEKGIVLEANLTAASLFDMARSALVQKPWTRFVLPADQDIYLKHWRRVFLGAGPQGCELRLVKSNGQSFWVRLEARLAVGQGGTRTCRTVLSDITERKRAEEALRSSEARHRSLFQNAPEALLTLAPPNWQFLSGNAASVAMFAAHDERELLSRSFGYYSRKTQPDGRRSTEKAGALLGAALRDGSSSFEWTFVRDGVTEFLATVAVTRMEAGDGPFLQAMVRDQTETRKQQAAAAQTERLASMGLLAASMGHEINNPLAYVLANAQDLAHVLPKFAALSARCAAGLHRVLGDASFSRVVGDDAALLEPARLLELSERAHSILDGARRMTRISKALSTFARVEIADRGKVDLEQAIECAIAMTSNEIRFCSDLVRDFKPLPFVWASKGKLAQVFLNLLINASHAMEEVEIAGRCITVSTWTQNGDVLAAVTDTGAGIEPQNMARLFEPFFSTKRMGVGSGLGLSMCRNIIGEFGGDIRVESEVGRGTRFIVRLPVWTEAAASSSTELGSPKVTSNLRGRILIVDDEAPLRLVMERLLCVHDVLCASSGKEALAILQHDRAFDVILCDLMMPEVTGVNVHQWLMAHEPSLAARVVFVTGGVFGAVAAEYLSAAGNLKIEKPFDASEFKRVVSDRIRTVKSEPRLAWVFQSANSGEKNS